MENKTQRKLQIGIMGSAADLKYSKKAEKVAKEIGKLIAESGNTLVYGAEKDCCSLSTLAAKSAKDNGGTTLGVTYGKTKECWGGEEYMPTVIMPCGHERGGGREFTLVLACDVIIALGGGSGTLNEMVVAYQANIPIVTYQAFKGWAKKLCGKFMDDRNRLLCQTAKTPAEAVTLAINSVTTKNKA